MPLKAQTAKFEAAKKTSEQGSMTAAVAAMPRQRRDSDAGKAGSEIAAVDDAATRANRRRPRPGR